MKQEIILGDCLEVMRGFSDKSFDLVLTDPPYGRPGEDWGVVRKAIIEMRRVSKTQIIILDWRNPLSITDDKFAELVWEYGWISGGRTKSKHHFYPTHNIIHFLGEDFFDFDTKGGSILKRRPGFSSPRQCSYAKKSGHPHEKPLALIKYILEKYRGDSVLDPFMGSGTTLVAAKLLNRNATGIEISPEYCKIAQERLDAQPNSLFV